MAVDEVEATAVATEELSVLERARKELGEASLIGATLDRIITSVRNGQSFLLGVSDEEVTPSVAAHFLKMSRPHVYKLLDADALRSHRVGRDRRIRMNDLLAFAEKRESARADLAERFARADEDRTALVAELAGVSVEAATKSGF